MNFRNRLDDIEIVFPNYNYVFKKMYVIKLKNF